MKIVMVSTFSMATNYSRDFAVAFRKITPKRDHIYLCGKKGESASDNYPPKIDKVWTPGWLFFFQILFFTLKKRPDIIHLQHEFRMYGNIISNILFPWLVLLLRISGCKTLITIHGVISLGLLEAGFMESFNLPKNFLTVKMGQLYLMYFYYLTGIFSNSIVVLAPALKEILIKEYKLPAKKINVIKIGIPEIKDRGSKPTNPNLLKKFPNLIKKEVILVFGYFSPRKGYPLLIQGFNRALQKNPKAKNWMMVLAGNVKKEFVPYKQEIKKMIHKMGCSKNIIITGYLEEEEIDQFYRLSKIGVIPAIFSLSTSGALSLALVYLKPILFADVKPASIEIQEGNLGLLYNPFNANSFAKKLEMILTNKKVYQQFFNSLAKEAPNRYWSNISLIHYQLYKKLLK